jgi:POT family proton-dependent oligopeptide transporter
MQQASHPLGVITLSFSKMLERFSYYGLRSILMLYVVKGPLQMDKYHASELYGYFTGLIILTPLLGGLIADLLLGCRKTAWIGGFIQALGCFLVAVPNTYFLYAGLIFIALGVGLYNPSSIAAMGYLYRSRSSGRADAGMMIFYASINVGALLAPLIIGGFFENYFSLGFVLCGLILCISQVILIVAGNSLTDVPDTAHIYIQEKPDQRVPMNAIPVLILITLFVPLFWCAYNLLNNINYELLYEGSYGAALQQMITLINPLMLLFAGIAAALVWTFFRSSPLFKIAIGFFIAICAILLLLALPAFRDSGIFLTFYVIVEVVMAIAEIFIAVPAFSFIARFSPAKFKTLLVAAYIAITGILNQLAVRLSSLADYTGSNVLSLLFSGLLLIAGIALLVVYFISRNSNNRADI